MILSSIMQIYSEQFLLQLDAKRIVSRAPSFYAHCFERVFLSVVTMAVNKGLPLSLRLVVVLALAMVVT